MKSIPESSLVFDRATIDATVDKLAAAVSQRCSQGEWTAMCVMNGALVFTAELIQRLSIPVRVDSLRVSRYHETTQGSHLRWHSRPESDIAGMRVLLIDDIFDEGETLAALDTFFREAGAAEVVSVVLLDKIHDHKVAGFKPDIVGLDCPDVYVFGYGMDIEGRYRNLPEIRQLNT